ncbi:MAG: BTAD domain-containing putative transcriptional regulator [Chloroflexi bacterium]|nr:BTAD domain-containing putative transcriptional regulator [Chloroflexota bacterium]
MLTVSLLGTPSFQLKNQALSYLITGRSAALLVYLAVTRQPQPRARLADLLWDDLAEQTAKTNLRYLLSNLRKVVGDYVVAQGDTVAFNQELPHWVDVTAFTTYLTPSASVRAEGCEPGILAELLKLYTGEFLAGFQLEEALVFENWMLAQRRHLHDLLVQGLQLRTHQHLTQGAYAEGLAINHYLLTLEPWREEAHRQRMLLLAYSGQRSAALQQYTRCCQALTEELDVPPMPQTTTLYEQIKSGQWFATHQANGRHLPIAIAPFPEGVSAPRQNGVAMASLSPSEMTPHFDLGAMPEAAHFYGRQAELATLHSWIGQEHSRLVALLGLSGQGKTALATAFVHDVIENEQHPAHGFTQVIWRSLQGAPSCTEILQGWLQQLDVGRSDVRSLPFDELVTRLFAILQTRRCLLVLDGMEALLAGPTVGNDGGTEAYAALLRLFFQRRHRSCLLLTSQIRPAVLTQLDERNGAFHCLELSGLTLADGAELLAAHSLASNPTIHQQLHQHYAGNPQWLSRAANLIYELFDGDGLAFLQEGLFFLGDIAAAMSQQLAQLSRIERQVLYQLAQADQPLAHQMLWATLMPLPTKTVYFQAIQSLQRTFLIQQADTQIKLAAPLAAYLAENTLALEANE